MASLVYVAAFAPDAGEPVGALIEKPGVARAPDFTEILVTGGQAGAIEPVRITGHDGRRAIGAVA